MPSQATVENKVKRPNDRLGVLVREGSKQREKAACLSSSMALGNHYSVSLCMMYYCLKVGTTSTCSSAGSCAWNREGWPRVGVPTFPC